MASSLMTLSHDDRHFFAEGETQTPETPVTNPFYVSDRPRVMEMEKRDLYQNYSRVLILCNRSGSSDYPPHQIAQPQLSEEELKRAGEHLVLMPADIRMVHIYRHKTRSCVVTEEHLKRFNHYQIPLNHEELVVLMPNHNEQYASLYRDLFSTTHDHTSFVAAVVFTSMYDSFWHSSVKRGLDKLRTQLKDTEYWETVSGLTNNEGFMERKFRFKGQLSDKIRASAIATNKFRGDEKTKALIERLENCASGLDYLKHMYRKDVYLDAADSCQKKGRRLFHLNEEPCSFQPDQITELFRLISKDPEMLYTVFNTFAVSKDLCHLVMHNVEVLKMMRPVFQKYAPVYRYLLGYPIMIDYLTEGIKKTFVKQDDSCVYTLDMVHQLPFFPYLQNNPKSTPYFPVSVSDQLLDSENNLMGVKIPQDLPEHWVTDLAGFKKRFNVFTTGSTEHNLFEGLNWDGLAVTGSLIPACCLEQPPLMKKLKLEGNESARWARYFNEYYSGDLDMLCTKTKSIFDFMDKAHEVTEAIKTNMEKMTPGSKDSLEITPEKTVGIVVSTEYIEKHMPEYETEWLIKNLETAAIKERFYELYISNKYQQNKQYRTYLAEQKRINPLYETFFKLESIDAITIHLVGTHLTKETTSENDNEIYVYRSELEGKKLAPEDDALLLKVAESIKFKIKSSHLIRSIELFRSRYAEPFSCVSRFHLGCVRGYYTGGENENLYLLPSAVCALMSMINPDYKYFAGTNDPIKIINKYRMRGWGTLLNDREKINVVEYNSHSPEWSKVFNLDSKNTESIKSHFGALGLEAEIFQPGKHFQGLPAEQLYQDTSAVKYFETEDDLCDYYRTRGFDENKSPLKLSAFQTIGADGYVNPLESALLDLGKKLLQEVPLPESSTGTMDSTQSSKHSADPVQPVKLKMDPMPQVKVEDNSSTAKKGKPLFAAKKSKKVAMEESDEDDW